MSAPRLPPPENPSSPARSGSPGRRTAWEGSTWDRVCREMFGGDEDRMLAWGRRYVAAHPDVGGPEFHLGAAFRGIVGARNREQWWRTAVEFLEHRAAARAATSGARDLGAAPPAAVGESAAEYIATEPRVRHPTLPVAERLRLFDEATERQRRREAGLPIVQPHGPPKDRGWTREDLYDRVFRD